jgi:mannose-1-phosphate guanylyltransferase / mannose-6-phosphate isomerase
MKLIPVILSGGSGSRLWPVSRMTRPKPFIKLADGQSLLQKAFLRGLSLPDVAEIVTVTNRDLFFQTEDELRPVNTSNCFTRFILEPFGRNTAAACITAALSVQSAYGDDAVLLVLAADHLIANGDAFIAAVNQAVTFAQQGKLVTFGIVPTAPEVGFGYIEAEGNNVRRFVEKPSLAHAQEYLAAGNFLWNSGMFCFTAGTLLAEMQKYAPDVVQQTRLTLAASQSVAGEGVSCVELDAEIFKQVPDISIDYALMERSDAVAVVPCNIGWSDIGSWNALGELCQKADAAGNRIEGEVVLHNTRNCYIQGSDRMIGVVGVQDVLIVDTPDALLVSSRDGVQDVKHLFAELKERAHATHTHHKTVHRPWGTYTVLEEGTGFKIKRIEVKAGGSLSLQMHHKRSEHWVVVSGVAQVVNGNKEITLQANESTYIPAGHRHRLSNREAEPLIIIEIQTGSYLGEDDIVRFNDVYGRVKEA